MATLNTDLITGEQAQAGVLHSADLAEQKTVAEVVDSVNKADSNEAALNALDSRVTANEDFNTAQSVINTNVEGRLSSVESFESSQVTKNSELDAADNGLSLRVDSLELFQSQQGVKNTELESADSALESRALSLESFETAQQATNTAFSNADAALSIRADSLESFESDQLATNTNVDNSISAIESKDAEQDVKLNQLSSSIVNYPSLDDAALSTLEVADVISVNGNDYIYAESAIRPDELSNIIKHVGATGYLQLVGGMPFNGINPEFFGLVGDYDFDTHTGTDNTNLARKMFNYAAERGATIYIGAGEKYLTDTINLDPINNADYPAKAGRVKVVGMSMGNITGGAESQGCGFAHINGSANRFFSIEGFYDINDAGDSGGFIHFENIMLIGGDQTTDVLYEESCNSMLIKKSIAIRIRNPDGNGWTEKTTWNQNAENVLIRGDADPLNNALNDVWTGIAHNICSNESNGQINMKVYSNVEIFRCGTGRVIGRGSATSGTIGPLVFIGGQISNCQNYGEIIGGGTYGLSSIGVQFEGCRLNGVRVDSQGSNDLPRGITYDRPYLTNNGRIEDGSDDSYAFANIDGVDVQVNSPTFQNTGDAIVVKPSSGALNTRVYNPTFRTVTAYGAASGTGFKLDGGNQAAGRFIFDNATFNQNFATNVDDSTNTLAVSEQGGRGNFSSGETVVNLGKSSTYDRYQWANFNNSSSTTVTNFFNGKEGQRLMITFSNVNTTIASNSNIFLRDGVSYTPSTSRKILELRLVGGVWVQAD